MAMSLTGRRFTVDEYHRMGEAGIFHEDDRVELLDGEIVVMSPIGSRHAGCVKGLVSLLYQALGRSAILGVQDPVILEPYSEPEPDVAVLKPQADTYRRGHPAPSDVLLLIEVAETSIEYDRETKVPLYAQAGIPEVWLVNLPADNIEVYRKPRGDRYTDIHTAHRGERLTPPQLPTVTLRVDDILG